jgi:hypothetical protein
MLCKIYLYSGTTKDSLQESQKLATATKKNNCGHYNGGTIKLVHDGKEVWYK